VRVLSRHAPEHAVDLRDGSGLAAALDGVDVVVNAANAARRAGDARLPGVLGRGSGLQATISPSVFYDGFPPAAPEC